VKREEQTIEHYLEVGTKCWFTQNVIESPGANNPEVSGSDIVEDQSHVEVCGHLKPICVRSIEPEKSMGHVRR
jgi:hypothetical protein